VVKEFSKFIVFSLQYENTMRGRVYVEHGTETAASLPFPVQCSVSPSLCTQFILFQASFVLLLLFAH
jgi:hypothetical protein